MSRKLVAAMLLSAWLPVFGSQKDHKTERYSQDCPVRFQSLHLNAVFLGNGAQDAYGANIYTDTNETYELVIKIKNVGTRSIDNIEIAKRYYDADLDGHEEIRKAEFETTLKPGHTATRYFDLYQPGGNMDRGMAVWVSAILYSDGTKWVDPYGDNSGNGDGTSCYWKDISY